MDPDQQPGTVAHPVEPDTLDYEAALAELDSVLARLEDGQVPLEEAMSLYERGVRLVRRGAALLDGAERRVTELTSGADGLPRERPLELDPDEEAGAEDG
ncbi:MAG TPA: exodeoxyribonuclease VII small subunit [Candidatus Dormibacteraeota bacterium]|nr:exodeoxyribonuclease VII small subunit [Candidatus Dormibacteraeota bacterium]